MRVTRFAVAVLLAGAGLVWPVAAQQPSSFYDLKTAQPRRQARRTSRSTKAR